MKKLLFTVVFTLIGMGIFAQQPVVAVAPFNVSSGISPTEASIITRVFFIRLGNTNKLRLVDRNVVDRILLEHDFQLSDWSNKKKTAELGAALNADWIIRGDLEEFESNILVTVQFYDIRTLEFKGGTDVLIANAEAAYENMDPLVNKLVETISISINSGNASISFKGDTLATRDRNTIVAGLQSAMQEKNLMLALSENAIAGQGYGFTFNIDFSSFPGSAHLLQADATVTFTQDGRVLCQTGPYYITEMSETLIARRIAERLRDDKVFFDRINDSLSMR